MECQLPTSHQSRLDIRCENSWKMTLQKSKLPPALQRVWTPCWASAVVCVLAAPSRFHLCHHSGVCASDCQSHQTARQKLCWKNQRWCCTRDWNSNSHTAYQCQWEWHLCEWWGRRTRLRWTSSHTRCWCIATGWLECNRTLSISRPPECGVGHSQVWKWRETNILKSMTFTPDPHMRTLDTTAISCSYS